VKTACARTPSSACSPTTSNGTSARPGPSCSSSTKSRRSLPTRSPGCERSQAAKRKASTQQTARGETCHSFGSLLAELALIVRDTNRIPHTGATFTKTTRPTTQQARALELAGANPTRL
jgi:hypothetical protein